ncbi:MAG: hypothetical protein Q9170_003804 [Blastenia crenularia]
MAGVQAAPKVSTAIPNPKLSPAEFKVYNGMADHMDLEVYKQGPNISHQHDNFRRTWNTIYPSDGKRPKGMSIRQYLNTGLSFCEHLHLHHTIEEQHIFPVLAKRMPAFSKELDLLAQHRQIHEGLDHLKDYLKECSAGKRELRLTELKTLMDSFGTVLWTHLNDEVEQLGAENMRKYWTMDEMRRMPM